MGYTMTALKGGPVHIVPPGMGVDRNFRRALLAGGCAVSQRFFDACLARPLFDRAGRLHQRSSRGHHLERGVRLDICDHVRSDL